MAKGKERLADEAAQYQKAWVIAALWVGYTPKSLNEFAVPDYAAFPRAQLEREVREIRDAFTRCLRLILNKKPFTNTIEERAVAYLGRWYEQFFESKGLLSIGTVLDFEKSVCRLPAVDVLDAPPYTELLIQGVRGLAYRHPEYMLARDVEFNYDLFWQAEELCDRNIMSTANWLGAAAENVQALARATILSCFSLIEATVSGLGLAHVMTSPGLDAKVRKKLTDNHGPLLSRLFEIPELVTGEALPLERSLPPISVLFGEIKERRDAFVHCEPGPQETRAGFVKEQRFHDVGPRAVDDAVKLTAEVVRILWKHVHKGSDGPKWIRSLGDRSKCLRGLILVPADH